MNKTSIKNVLAITRFDFKCHRKYIVGWILALMGFMSLYMVFFPFISDLGVAKFEVLPEEMLQLFQVNSFNDLANYNAYYEMIMNIILIAMSIFGASLASHLLSDEERKGTIEFLSSLAVSRKEIFLAKLFTLVLVISLALYATNFAATLIGFLGGYESFNFIELLESAKTSAITPFFFSLLTFAIAGFSSKYGSSSTGSALVFISYMFGYLGKLLGEKASFLKYFSPFESFSLPLSQEVLITMAVYLFILFIAVLMGLTKYQKRDFKL